MKTIRILLVLAVLIGALGLASAPTMAQKLNPYTSSITVQNMSASTANITVTYYNLNGTIALTANDTLGANAGKAYFPLPVADGFNGSAVVSSDQPLAAVSNLQTTDGTARTSFVGASTGSTTVYMPNLQSKNGAVSNDTWYSVQNAGSTTATVNIAYSDGTSAGPLSIEPGASQTVNNATETHSLKIFSGVITSSQPVVAVVVQEKKPNTGVMYAYTAPTTSGATSLTFPTVTENNSNNRVGIQIQNTGASSTTVTLTYAPAPGVPGNFVGTCTEQNTIAAGASVTFGFPAWQATAPAGYTGTSTCPRGQKFLGNAYVSANTGNMKLQGVVNQAKDGTNRAGAYTGFAPEQASAKVLMPLVMDRNGVSARLYTAFSLFNMGTDTFYKCTISGAIAGAPLSNVVSGSLAANNSVVISELMMFGQNFIGSAYCITYTDNTYTTVNTGGKLVAVVNEVTYYSSPADAAFGWDTLMIYEGVNTTP